MDIAERAERSIQQDFHHSIWSKFDKAIMNYNLINAGDKIAVCVSGGKDSMLMAKLFQELSRHSRVPFGLVFLMMDPGYSPENRYLIEKNAKSLAIPITVFETDIFRSVFNVNKNPCFLCSKMRRGHLYSKARELGCNKIALGHHFDDVIETTLMSMLYGGQIRTMLPKLKSENFDGMEIIRPMYLIREAEIIRWSEFNELRFLRCACRFTENNDNYEENNSKREEIKRLIAELKKTNPQVEMNIFKSAENVDLNAVAGFKYKKEKHSFLEFF